MSFGEPPPQEGGLDTIPDPSLSISPDLPPSSPPPPTAGKARIGYRTEYRHLRTRELIRDETYEAPQIDLSATDHTQDLVFELVKTYLYIPGPNIKDTDLGLLGVTEPTYAVRIYSPAIINALRAVVRYYPSQDLNGDITINSPYCILVHHYDELKEYAKTRSAMPPESLCMRDRLVGEHMEVLMKYLDETVMEGVKAEIERNARGYYTFEHAWVGRKPGKTIIVNRKSDNDYWEAGVIWSLSGGTFQTPPTPWSYAYWKLEFDGRYLTRRWAAGSSDRFDGESSYETSGVKLLDTEEVEDSADPVVQQLVEWGRTYCRLLENQYMHHKGRSATFPYQQIDGLVMADAEEAVDFDRPDDFMSESDLRKKGWRCSCIVCRETRSKGDESEFQALFEDYQEIGSERWMEDELTTHQYLLCPYELLVFVFKTRSWVRVNIANLREPEFDEGMVKNLIMDEAKKRTLTSLAKSFARRNNAGETIEKPMWSADFVLGKGTGLIFLLHGKPGVGKTLTAECIAAFTRRPLMVLTSSDIGTNPKDVEQQLSVYFRQAKSWGAVLLIDEADVFMERRSTADLTRNSLVAGFLRALEYYEGILFLTTNRVGSFDDAFISRVHVQLYYPEFTDDQRHKVWQTFIDKLEQERKGYMRLSYAAKEFIRETKNNLKWNGREIRNAFQTAVSLAEYDAEKDGEGTILVTDHHLQAVVELSKDFKDYLKELHMGDEAKRAEARVERLDSFRGDKS